MLSASQGRDSDWHGYFSQPPKQYCQNLEDCLREETEFAIVDLMKLSHGQKIVADVGISPAIRRKISEPSRIVLLFAPEEMSRKLYFDREDKQDINRLIQSFPDGNELLHNVIEALHYKAAAKRKSYYDSGFCCIERRVDDTIERTLDKTEKHFGLFSRG